jgi:hypothetical protein
MKTLLSILLMAFFILSAIPACKTTSTPTPVALPTVTAISGVTPATVVTDTPSPVVSTTTATNQTPQAPGDLGPISYTLDTARKVSDTFDFSANKPLSLGVKDANGYAWMLWIPADALLASQTISMTPFATIDTSQSGAKIVSGVQLEPDGLEFVSAARLTVTAPMENPGVSLILTFQQGGSKVAFAPTTNTTGGKTAIAEIWHFSAAGTDNGANAGDDGLDRYRKMAEEQYRWALAAAKAFIQNGAPPAPEPPAVSQFCRGTEVNPEETIQADLFEFSHEFFDPYNDIVPILLAAIKAMQLVGSEVDTTAGWEAAQQIAKMAEQSILEVGSTYRLERPPDHLFAVSVVALTVEKNVALLGAPTEIMEYITGWAQVIRDYYLQQLKSEHDYRSFPYLMTLEKYAELLGATNRLGEIFSAMTFEVTIDTSFDATWISGDKVTNKGNVVQNADVKEIRNELTPPDFLWGTMNNMVLKAKSGTYTDHTGTYPLAGQSDTGNLWLLNWDACVTKTFDVMISGFIGDNQGQSGIVAGASSEISFKQYIWQATGGSAFMFTIPIENLNVKMGEQSFSGSGSAADGDFASTGQIHIVIKHTPE